MTLPVTTSRYNELASNLGIGNYQTRYLELLKGPWPTDAEKYELVANNPYYAAINATACVLRHGNFRGYQHMRSVFFEPSSYHYIGICVEHERTRVKWDADKVDAGPHYVSDWYIETRYDVGEAIYRAAYLMLSVSTGITYAKLRSFSIHNDLNIRQRTHDDGDKAQNIKTDSNHIGHRNHRRLR